MCRAGGRRCAGGHSRATQATRQQRSRAKKALREARAGGDPDAIRTATERLANANAAHEAAKENAMSHHDHNDAADQAGDVTTPKPKPGPVTGALSEKPLLDNTWGNILDNSPVHYHDDGPIGTAVKYMGKDAHMDVDGEPLANVVGKLATDVVRRKTTAQQAVDDLKAVRDRLPEDSRANRCLSQAIRAMDGPDTPVPQVPDGTPEPLRDLVRKLHAVPMVRRDPELELQPLTDICGRLAAGDQRTAGLLPDLVKRLRNKRHESMGDSGKFEIDDAVKDAITALNEQERQERQQRAQQRATAAGSQPATEDSGALSPGELRTTPGQHGDVTAENAAQQPRTEDTVRQTGNVTNIVHGENHGYQTGHINGGLTFDASTGRATIGNNRGEGGDVTFTAGGARNHSAHTQDRARYQEERAQYRQERERYKAERAAQAGQGASQNGGSGPVNITDANGNVFLQAGSVRGGVWVNGKRVQ